MSNSNQGPIEQLEKLAKEIESKGSRTNAPGLISGAQIKAEIVKYQQQDKLLNELNCMNSRFKQLDGTVSKLESAINEFNKDSGKLYIHLIIWTAVIALATVLNIFF